MSEENTQPDMSGEKQQAARGESGAMPCSPAHFWMMGWLRREAKLKKGDGDVICKVIIRICVAHDRTGGLRKEIRPWREQARSMENAPSD